MAAVIEDDGFVEVTGGGPSTADRLRQAVSNLLGNAAQHGAVDAPTS